MRRIAVTVVLSVLALAGTAGAVTWTGPDMNWTQPDDTSSFDSNYSSNDIVQFNGSGQGTITLGTVTPGGVTISAGTYTFSGGSIGGTGTVTMSNSGTLTNLCANTYTGGTVIDGGTISISANNSLGAAGSTLTFNGLGGLTLSTAMTSDHPIVLNSGAVMSLKVSVTGGTISGAITGAGGIDWVSTASSTLTLSSSGNTFTGPIGATGAAMGADGDVFRFASIGDAPGAGGIYFNNSGSGSSPIYYIGSANLTLNYRQLVVKRTASVSGMGNPSNAIWSEGTGTLTINTDMVVIPTSGNPWFGFGGSNTGTNSFNGRITDGAGSVLRILKIGGGNWYFSGTNTYTGGTELRGGLLTFQGIQALPASGGINFNSGSAAILDDARGVIERSGVNLQENNRPFTVFVGNNNTANGGRSSGTTVGSVISLGVLNLTSASGWYSRQMNITGANGYSGRLAGANLSCWGGPYAGKFNPTTASIQITGTVVQANGKTLASLSGGTDAQPSPYLSLDGTARGNVISGTIKDALDYTDLSNPNARALGVTKSSTSEWTLSGTNTYTGTNTLTAGTLIISEDANLGLTNALVFNGGTLRITGTTLNSYAAGLIGTHPVTLTASAVSLDIADPANVFTVSTVLNHGGGLTKAGAGTLVLNAVNTYTGVTTVNAGTLKLRDPGSGLSQTVSNLVLAGPDVTLHSDRVGGTLSTTFGTLTTRVAGNTANIVYTGGSIGTENLINLVQGGGFIDKGVFLNGTNYAAMNAANTYVRALTYGGDPNTSGIDSIGGGTHVKLTATPGARAGDSLLSLNLYGSGVGYTMISGTLTVPGILKGGGGTSTISGGTAVTGGAELVIRTDTAADLLAISTPVTGAFALTKSGAGALTLSGINTYSGASSINGGTFEIAGSGSLNSGSYAGAIAIAAGALFNYNSSATQAVSGVVSGSGSLAVNGSGKLTLSATNTYTGSTTITGGTLEIGGAGLLGSGIYAASITNNGTLLYNSSANQVVTGAISGTGTTTINAGTFSMQGSFGGTSRVKVGPGGKLMLNFQGTNKVFQLYLNGVPVYGIWGPVGSGVLNQSGLLGGTGIMMIPPVAGTVITVR